MTPASLITAAIEHHLALGGEDASDADYRERGLLHLQQAGQERWVEQKWWFRQGSASITIDTTGRGPLPADFSSFGKEGFVIVPGTQIPLEWREPRSLLLLREMDTAASTQPTLYTLHDGNGTGTRYLQVYRKPNASLAVKAYYLRNCPVFTDGGDQLDSFPEDFHEAVLLQDVVALYMRDEGDLRSVEVEKKADRACRRLWAEHKQGLQQRRRGPRYGQGVYR